MRRAIALLLVCGCASGGAAGGSETPTRQSAIFQSAETGTIMGDRPQAAALAIAAPATTVWIAAKKVYADLDIPLTVENPAARQIGNQNFIKIRQMAGQPMTEWVDCGSGMTGQKALTYRLFLSLLTDVVPDGKGGTTLKTTFVATGQDVMQGSSDRIPCGSTGRFEQYFLAKVQETVGK